MRNENVVSPNSVLFVFKLFTASFFVYTEYYTLYFVNVKE